MLKKIGITMTFVGALIFSIGAAATFAGGEKCPADCKCPKDVKCAKDCAEGKSETCSCKH